MFTCTSLTQLCCCSSKGIVCLHVFRLENPAIIRQKVFCVCVCIPFRKICYYSSKGVLCECVCVCIPFRKFCYYSSKAVVCLRVPRLKSSAVILHKILCVYMYSVYKTLRLLLKVIVSLHVLHLKKTLLLFVGSYCGYMYCVNKRQLFIRTFYGFM
jgi:hypothetical protein